ncbi:hypothetical protein AA0117_g2778 [Alternaria alternata]|uniref:Cytochrome P450 monooxygenase-like protein n=1 Tax=Alternaria alternata TaxID=5599 RepID=A0A4Q4NNX0_ALTAL|nr:hypothetical protein AA0117_g2778 [Alternaria alternata]
MEYNIATPSVLELSISLILAYLVYSLFQAVYNITLHPLSKYPGPKLRGAFWISNSFDVLAGTVPHSCLKLHEQYGDVVRINPNTISFVKPEAWRDVYGYGTTTPLLKDPKFYYRPPTDISSANNSDHARIRRPLNHAFSEQALRSQESIITSYINLLVEKLRQRADSQTPVDITRWLNFTTFDIIGDLTFDESFGALDKEMYHSWMVNLFKALRFAGIVHIIKRYPIIGVPATRLLKWMPALAKAEFEHNNFTEEKTARRLASKTERKDILSYAVKNIKGEVTDLELNHTCGTIILGGSETSATLLSGAIYHLLKSPAWMEKLHRELAATFKSESEISFASLSQLKVLNAVIQETFRIYPPAPSALPRVVPPAGAEVCGDALPPGTQVGISQYAMYHTSSHFTDPKVYAPERFLGAEKYAKDKRHVIQPFSVGPRNCIGQNLAWAEIRSILARLVWHFELELLEPEKRWDDQKVFVLWQKPSLMVKLRARDPGS